MGITGLWKALTENSPTIGRVQRVQLPNSNGQPVSLIFDALAMWRKLYEPGDWICGGQFAYLQQNVAEFVENCRMSGFEPVFVFDGPDEEVKVEEMTRRRKERTNKIKNVMESIENHSVPNRNWMQPPQNVSDNLVEALEAAGVECVFSIVEADRILAQECTKRQAFGVVSGDSDLLCMPAIPRVVSPDKISFSSSSSTSWRDITSPKTMEAQVYPQGDVLRALGLDQGLDQSPVNAELLCAIPVLADSDYSAAGRGLFLQSIGVVRRQASNADLIRAVCAFIAKHHHLTLSELIRTVSEKAGNEFDYDDAMSKCNMYRYGLDLDSKSQSESDVLMMSAELSSICGPPATARPVQPVPKQTQRQSNSSWVKVDSISNSHLHTQRSEESRQRPMQVPPQMYPAAAPGGGGGGYGHAYHSYGSGSGAPVQYGYGQQNEVCRHFAKFGRCRFGDTCRYMHDIGGRRTEMGSSRSWRNDSRHIAPRPKSTSASASSSSSRPTGRSWKEKETDSQRERRLARDALIPCRMYAQGSCSYGSKCHFLHAGPEAVQSPTPTPAPAPVPIAALTPTQATATATPPTPTSSDDASTRYPIPMSLIQQYLRHDGGVGKSHLSMLMGVADDASRTLDYSPLGDQFTRSFIVSSLLRRRLYGFCLASCLHAGSNNMNPVDNDRSLSRSRAYFQDWAVADPIFVEVRVMERVNIKPILTSWMPWGTEDEAQNVGQAISIESIQNLNKDEQLTLFLDCVSPDVDVADVDGGSSGEFDIHSPQSRSAIFDEILDLAPPHIVTVLGLCYAFAAYPNCALQSLAHAKAVILMSILSESTGTKLDNQRFNLTLPSASTVRLCTLWWNLVCQMRKVHNLMSRPLGAAAFRSTTLFNGRLLAALTAVTTGGDDSVRQVLDWLGRDAEHIYSSMLRFVILCAGGDRLKSGRGGGGVKEANQLIRLLSA